jgi:hypothetical protein
MNFDQAIALEEKALALLKKERDDLRSDRRFPGGPEYSHVEREIEQATQRLSLYHDKQPYREILGEPGLAEEWWPSWEATRVSKPFHFQKNPLDF